ncbi:MAG TPA: ABC transporter permease [Gaiellaceae bacterium]|nr:ABC transporter permease [Gaiellaceae bacterium]
MKLSPQTLAQAAFRLREAGIFIALTVAVLLFWARANNFMTIANWQDIATDVAIVAVLAVGQTMVVLTRNIDLSVGSIVGLTAYISSDTLAHHHGLPLGVVVLLAVTIGIGLGLVNGLLVTVGRIPAIIATIGTLAIFRGLLFEITNGQNVLAFQLPERFLNLAARKPVGLPFLAWIAIAIAIAGAAVLRWAPWGRDFYAVGSNPDAARYAGIPVGRRVLTAFVLSGALAGLGGFMFAARFASVDAVAGTNLEFDAVTAVVIGGVNVFGGSGTVLGAALGAVLVATIQDGFTLLKLSEFWKMFFNGTAIVVAVTIDALVTQRLQEALRRRRRAEMVAAREQGAAT